MGRLPRFPLFVLSWGLRGTCALACARDSARAAGRVSSSARGKGQRAKGARALALWQVCALD